jgi:hypothetical protein
MKTILRGISKYMTYSLYLVNKLGIVSSHTQSETVDDERNNLQEVNYQFYGI